MRRATWIRFVAVILARGVLATIFGAAFWAVAPMALGWHTTTVMTGSMEPALHPGDIVVSKTITTKELRKGQVLLFSDPDHVGTLRLHRFDSLNADGSLTTKGDANPVADSTHISRSDVLGVGYFRIPGLGTPIIWAEEHQVGPLVAVGFGAVVLSALAVTPASSPSEGSTFPRGRHRQPRKRRRLSPVMAAIAVGSIVALGVPEPAAAAAFSNTTTTLASTLGTATATPVTALTCTSNADGSVTIGWAYNGSAPDRFTTLIDGVASSDTSAPTARATILSPRELFSFRRSTINIRTDLTSTWTATSTSAVQIVTVRFLGIGRTSCA